ncbi:hypothetical protein F5Y15DRAFT_381087 [Xylariaceae sp. FL0016]|nr:hypothetical protein F5Y15DRAFT_381087 [Xylariaceae sp. FL0016]
MGAELELLYTFAGLDSLTGVVAGTGKKRDGDGDGEDTLLVLGGNITGPGAGVPGSWAVWQVAGFGSSNLDGGTGRGLASTSTATKVADIPGDVFPNGIALLPNDDNVVLISDSKNGALLRLDRAANRLDTILCAPEMAPVLGAKPAIGINGLKIRDGWAYWGNSFASTIYRSCLNSTGFHCANGSRKAERVAEVPGTWLDDFAFGSDDIIWAATNVNNTVVAIDAAQNRSEVVAGATDSLELAGVTAVDFGRRAGERTLLFFSTSGGLAYPVNGSIVEPGKGKCSSYSCLSVLEVSESTLSFKSGRSLCKRSWILV